MQQSLAVKHKGNFYGLLLDVAKVETLRSEFILFPEHNCLSVYSKINRCLPATINEYPLPINDVGSNYVG